MDINLALDMAKVTMKTAYELAIAVLVPALKDGLNGKIENGEYSGQTVEQFINEASQFLADRDSKKAQEMLDELMNKIAEK